jgi:peptidoglycan/LPS O-acetylase OafA/YrhL
LRALAAGSILVFHVWLESSPSGTEADLGPVSRYLVPQLPLGVTLFFVLSGFLLYRPFMAAVLRERERPSLLKYLRNRALRILPAYWFILLVVAVVLQAALVYDNAGDRGPGKLDDPVVLAKNALFIQNYETPWTGSFFTGIGPAWSLAIEAVFYLALPLLVLLAFVLAKSARTRTQRRIAALAPVAVLLLIGIAGKLVIYFLGIPVWGVVGREAWSTGLYWTFPGNADKFAFGMALAVLFVDAEDGSLRLPRWWPAGAAVALLAVALPTAKFMSNNNGTKDGSNLVYNSLMAFACALLVALVVLPRREGGRQWLVPLLETRFFVGAGLVSYSLFLWHAPVIYWLRRHDLTLAGADGFAVNLLLVSTVAGLLSVLTYRWIEVPALRRKSRAGSGPVEAVPAHQLQAAP